MKALPRTVVRGVGLWRQNDVEGENVPAGEAAIDREQSEEAGAHQGRDDQQHGAQTGFESHQDAARRSAAMPCGVRRLGSAQRRRDGTPAQSRQSADEQGGSDGHGESEQQNAPIDADTCEPRQIDGRGQHDPGDSPLSDQQAGKAAEQAKREPLAKHVDDQPEG